MGARTCTKFLGCELGQRILQKYVGTKGWLQLHLQSCCMRVTAVEHDVAMVETAAMPASIYEDSEAAAFQSGSYSPGLFKRCRRRSACG